MIVFSQIKSHFNILIDWKLHLELIPLLPPGRDCQYCFSGAIFSVYQLIVFCAAFLASPSLGCCNDWHLTVITALMLRYTEAAQPVQILWSLLSVKDGISLCAKYMLLYCLYCPDSRQDMLTVFILLNFIFSNSDKICPKIQNWIWNVGLFFDTFWFETS